MAHAVQDDRIAVRSSAGVDLGRTIFAFTRRSASERPALRALIRALRG